VTTPRFPRYEPAAPRCAGGPQPGAVAFMDWVVNDWRRGGVFNLGIYNCRTVRGSVQPSVHGDGRACDFGFPLVAGRANPAGWDLVRLLLPHVDQLGIQMIIWDRTVWSARTPNGGPYTGVAAHRDHIHAELTRNASQTLTRARVRGIVTPPAPAPVQRPAAFTAPQEDDDMAVHIRLALPKGKHPHAGRIEVVTAMHRRWMPADELALHQALGGKIIDCKTAKQYNAWTANKVPIGTNGITGPI
jgi:hypothetical protein